MSKKVKMVLHAEPGVGKSTFASKAPHPYFIATDGNYEWLGLPDEDHKQVYSWSETVKIINEMITNPEKYAKYETIVVDLIEDLFKWCEFEYCEKNRIEHIGDIGYGKGYDIVNNQFFIEMCKLISIDKHIIFLAHGYTKVEKDRRGVEIYKYYPSDRIRSKVWDMIEGRVRYFLRAYVKGEEEEGRVVKRRYLSLIPKENEFGIARGLDEENTPTDINLDWNEFAAIIGLDDVNIVKVETKPVEEVKAKPVKKVKTEPVVEEVKAKPVEEVKTEVVVETKPLKETVTIVEEPTIETEVVVENSPTIEEVKPVVEEVKTETKVLTQAEKVAALRAKVAAMKNNENK